MGMYGDTPPELNGLDMNEVIDSAERVLEQQPLPPIEPGFTRLYRGDRVDELGNPIVDGARTNAPGRWYTDNPNAAEGYAGWRLRGEEDSTRPRYQFIDIPVEDAQRFAAQNLSSEELVEAHGTGSIPSSEWLLPSDVADHAQEYFISSTEQIYSDGVEAELGYFFSQPGVAESLHGMGVSVDALPEVLHNPDKTLRILLQLGSYLGQGQLEVSDKELFQKGLKELTVAVESANKKRYTQ